MLASTSPDTLNPSDVETFLQELVTRFEPDNEIGDILGPVVRHLLFHQSLWRAEGLGGGDASWRGVVSGLEALVSIKPIAIMITRMPEWIPASATAATFEKVTLLGPLCRLSVFAREWVGTLNHIPLSLLAHSVLAIYRTDIFLQPRKALKSRC